MQFHLNGFRPGDPEISEPAADYKGPSDSLPAEVDVLIIGCGPAGLTLAAQLAAFPDINTRIVEQKAGPLWRTSSSLNGLMIAVIIFMTLYPLRQESRAAARRPVSLNYLRSKVLPIVNTMF